MDKKSAWPYNEILRRKLLRRYLRNSYLRSYLRNTYQYMTTEMKVILVSWKFVLIYVYDNGNESSQLKVYILICLHVFWSCFEVCLKSVWSMFEIFNKLSWLRFCDFFKESLCFISTKCIQTQTVLLNTCKSYLRSYFYILYKYKPVRTKVYIPS